MITVLLLSLALHHARLLEPGFNIRTEEGRQAFREELVIALTQAKATPATRLQYRKEAEELAAKLFRMGQIKYDLPSIQLKLFWDSIKLDEIGVAKSDSYSIHLSEIMFFTYHEEYMKTVIPHEVAHLLHTQKWGIGNLFHDGSFDSIVKTIAPDYRLIDLDKTPACRLLRRLVAAEGYTGPIPVCG